MYLFILSLPSLAYKLQESRDFVLYTSVLLQACSLPGTKNTLDMYLLSAGKNDLMNKLADK